MATQVLQDHGSLNQQDEESDAVVWVVKNTPACNVVFRSPNFVTGQHRDLTWFLKLSTHQARYPSLSKCTLELWLKESKIPLQLCKVRVEMSFAGCPTGRFDNFGAERYATKMQSVAVFTAVERDITSAEPSPSQLGCLKIYCRITKCDPCTNSETPQKTYKSQALEHSVSRDLGFLMSSEKFSDVELVVGHQKFHAHKIILASRSPVFLAMFENNMQEKILNRIDIPDIHPNAMKQMLRYIYTDEVEDIEDCAGDLIAAAEKYQLEGLKSFISKLIIKKLDEENVIQSLILADLYHVDTLKENALRFIAIHLKDIDKIKQIDTLVSSHPSLLKEIIVAISKHQK